jgi:nicotinamidase-related amidase
MLSHPSLPAERAALLIYHFTEHHTRPGSDGYEPAMVDGLPAVRRLLAHCRATAVLVVYMISETPRDPAIGDAISDAIAPLPSEPVIRQAASVGSSGGAFATPAFADLLHARGRDLLLITGVAIDRGLNDTARRARGSGIMPFLVRDACFAQDIAESPVGPVAKEDIERVHLAALYRQGIGIMTIDEVIAALH